MQKEDSMEKVTGKLKELLKVNDVVMEVKKSG